MRESGPPLFSGRLAATPLLEAFERLLHDLGVENGFCGTIAALPRDESDARVAARPALAGRVARVLVQVRVTPRWMLESAPLDVDRFCDAMIASEGRSGTVRDSARQGVRRRFEACFGPRLDPDPVEVGAALEVLDRRDRQHQLVV
ncbi:MAG: hypothetical protein AAFV86_18910 [Pseudomonadota bacterium]